MNFRFLWILIFIGMTLIVSFSPSSVYADHLLGSSCTSFLIDGLTPDNHGPLFQGRTYNFSITMSNAGDVTWSPTVSATNPGEFKFGAACPNDRTTWGTGVCDRDGNAADSSQGSRPNRIDLTRDVPPGDSYTFNLSATTPTTAGVYLMVYRMVWEGIQWFGAACQPSLQVDDSAVIPPPPPPASGGSCPTGVDPGQACSECVAERCDDLSICATGHTYCVFDPNGNYCGDCVGEVDKCATQCVTSPGGGGTFDVGPLPAGLAQIQQTFINVVGIAVVLGFVALFVFLTWAGFKYLISGGEPKAIHAAHQTVTWALLGVLFLAIAWLILRLIEAFTGIKVTIFNVFVLPQ